uniref:Uncharacterized protein n=1 Tax=Oryza rufipogon TaxID=4529 RepID=A0A0E0RHE0_ORYRU
MASHSCPNTSNSNGALTYSREAGKGCSNEKPFLLLQKMTLKYQNGKFRSLPPNGSLLHLDSMSDQVESSGINWRV